jgi:hypothetical protein
MRGNANALIDARTITAHSPPVMQDELAISDLPHSMCILPDFCS